MNLNMLSIKQLNRGFDKKEFTPSRMIKNNGEAIKNHNEKFNFYINTFEDEALKKAGNMPERKSPLSGIGVAVSDCILTRGYKTTCGSKMLKDFVGPYDGTAFLKIMEAGSILLGKANVAEFAMGLDTENSSFGRTINPFKEDLSADGAPVAVALGGAVWALASDDGGTLRQNAASLNLVGLKPTYGLVSRYGLIGSTSSLGQIGSITRTVEDSALILGIIAGYDPKDSTSIKAPAKDYMARIDHGIGGLKIGVDGDILNLPQTGEHKKNLEEALKVFEDLGAIVEYVNFKTFEFLLPSYLTLAFGEAGSNMGRYDGVKYGYRTSPYRDLDEMYKKSRYEAFGDETRKRILLGTHILSKEQYDSYYLNAMKARRLIREEYDDMFKKYDLIAGPAAASKVDGGSGYDELLPSLAANICGLPAITVPCGITPSGLPSGLQLLGQRLSEETLLRSARAFEQRTPFINHKPREVQI